VSYSFSNGKVTENNELWKIWEEAFVAYCKGISQNLFGGTQETMKILSECSGLWIKIGTNIKNNEGCYVTNKVFRNSCLLFRDVTFLCCAILEARN